MREKVRRREYLVTFHARKEMNDDGFTIFDLERGILTGKIIERQRDLNTSEWKYRMEGKTLDNRKIELITKFSPTNKLVIITVYTP